MTIQITLAGPRGSGPSAPAEGQAPEPSIASLHEAACREEEIKKHAQFLARTGVLTSRNHTFCSRALVSLQTELT